MAGSVEETPWGWRWTWAPVSRCVPTTSGPTRAGWDDLQAASLATNLTPSTGERLPVIGIGTIHPVLLAGTQVRLEPVAVEHVEPPAGIGPDTALSSKTDTRFYYAESILDAGPPRIPRRPRVMCQLRR